MQAIATTQEVAKVSMSYPDAERIVCFVCDAHRHQSERRCGVCLAAESVPLRIAQAMGWA